MLTMVVVMTTKSKLCRGGVKGGEGIRGKENEGHLTEQGRWDEASERKA